MLLNAPVPDNEVENPDPMRPNVSISDLLSQVRRQIQWRSTAD